MAILAQTRFRRVRTHVPASLRVPKSALGKILSLWPEGRHEPYGRLEGYAGTRSSRYTWGAGGKEFEEETGHVKFGVRDYDPMSGLWMSKDPKGQFASPFVYAGNGVNPLKGIDTNGSVFGTNAQQLNATLIENNYYGSQILKSDFHDLEVSSRTFEFEFEPGIDYAYNENGMAYLPTKATNPIEQAVLFRHEAWSHELKGEKGAHWHNLTAIFKDKNNIRTYGELLSRNHSLYEGLKANANVCQEYDPIYERDYEVWNEIIQSSGSANGGNE